MRPQYVVCGSYPGAVPWEYGPVNDEPPAMIAEQLARSAGCEYYTVDGVTFGPFLAAPQVEIIARRDAH